MTLKTLGMGAVKFLKTVAGKGTKARNEASAKIFKQWKKEQSELEKLKIKAKSRRIEKEIESKTGKK